MFLLSDLLYPKLAILSSLRGFDGHIRHNKPKNTKNLFIMRIEKITDFVIVLFYMYDASGITEYFNMAEAKINL